MKSKILHKITNVSKKLDSLNRIEISKSAILANFKAFQALHPGSAIFPVLKANAYGHGLKKVAEILNELNLEYVCVDSYYEYLKIKDYINSKILIIGYNKLKNINFYNLKRVTLSVFDIETIKKLDSLNKKVTIHLKIDSGMNRQGILPEELNPILEIIKTNTNINLEGVYSHLADADNSDDQNYSDYQINNFKQAIHKIESYGFLIKYKHLSNSAGALKIFDGAFNSIRLGIGLYGYNPLNRNDKDYNKIKLQPALEYYSTVVQIKPIEIGAKISYNLMFKASKEMRIGIIPAGYYDGVNRRLSNIGYFSKDNELLRILGRVCMNITIIDLTESTVEKYNEVKIISNEIENPNSLYNISKLCDTIPYVILTKLAESTRRVIVK